MSKEADTGFNGNARIAKMPQDRELFLIECKIRRGGFSTERIFTIEGAQGEFSGYYEHFLNAERLPLDISEPAPKEEIEGFAKCRIIEVRPDGTVVVDVPSADVLLLPGKDLVKA